MDIRTAAHYLQRGYRIARQKWLHLDYKYLESNGPVGFYLLEEDLLADDWEIDRRFLLKDLDVILYDGYKF